MRVIDSHLYKEKNIGKYAILSGILTVNELNAYG